MERRREHQSQRHVRSGTLQSVVKVPAAHDRLTYSSWVACSEGPKRSLLLSQSDNGSGLYGSLSLADADQGTIRSVDHIRSLRLPFLAFLDRLGRLSIVKAGDNSKLGEDEQLQPLCWYKINPDTGSIIDEARKYFWALPINRLHHASSSRVLAMADASTMAVLNADTLQEISSFAISHRHWGLASQPIPSLGDVRWCHDGSMLAVLLLRQVQPWPGGQIPHLHAEVHIYDAVSGACLSSLQLQANRMTISWSGRSNLLAIFCDRILSGAAAPAGGAVNIRNDVRIVDPVTQRVELLPHLHVDQRLSSDTERPFKGRSVSSTSAEPPNAEWKAFGWTPCGDMLLGTWRCSEPPYTWGFALMDQLSLRCIYADVGSADKMTWASAAANGSQGAQRTAYFPLLYTKLELLHVTGKWQAEANYLKHVISCGELAHLAPDGGSLVIHAAHTGCLSHLNLKSDARCAVTPSLPQLFREELPPQWAPFPRGWTPAYAHVHDFPSEERAGASSSQVSLPRLIVLTDAKRHRILGTWTAASLMSQAGGQQPDRAGEGEPHSVAWSPHGLHLAVYSLSWTLIMTFGPAV